MPGSNRLMSPALVVSAGESSVVFSLACRCLRTGQRVSTPSSPSLLGPRELHLETGPIVRRRIYDLDPSANLSDELLHETQTQTHSRPERALKTRGRGEKGIPDSVAEFRRHANARIQYFDNMPLGIVPRAKGDALRIGFALHRDDRLQGICIEIQKNPTVNGDRYRRSLKVIWHLAFHINIAFLRKATEPLNYAANLRSRLEYERMWRSDGVNKRSGVLDLTSDCFEALLDCLARVAKFRIFLGEMPQCLRGVPQCLHNLLRFMRHEGRNDPNRAHERRL